MEDALSVTPSEKDHCDRFCFNEGSCFECARDPYGLAQCLGCVCPQYLWTGERCELRIGRLGTQNYTEVTFILTCVFAMLTLLLSCFFIYFYFKIRKSHPDPFLVPPDQQLPMSSMAKRIGEITRLPSSANSYFKSEVSFVAPKCN